MFIRGFEIKHLTRLIIGFVITLVLTLTLDTAVTPQPNPVQDAQSIPTKQQRPVDSSSPQVEQPKPEGNAQPTPTQQQLPEDSSPPPDTKLIPIPTNLESDSNGSSVVLQGETLFEIKEGVGSFSPEFRAQTISKRIKEFAQKAELKVDTIQLVDNPNTLSTNIKVGEEVLVTLLDVDAKAADTTREKLANEYVIAIKAAVTTYRQSFQVQNILLGASYAFLLTIATLIVLLLLNRWLKQFNTKLRTWEGTRIPSIRVLGTEVIPANRMVDFLSESLKLVRLALYLVIGAVYIQLVLGFFPWTRGTARRLFGFFLATGAAFLTRIINYLPNLFFLGLIILITSYTLRFIKFLFAEIQNGDITFPGFYPEWSKPTYNIVRFAIIAFAITVAFPYLPGSQTPAFQGISVFIGVLFSLGSSGAVANFVAGIILTYSRAFVVGDRVKISDTIGDVVEKTLLVTRINTIKNVIITIPNALVLGSHIINYSGSVRYQGSPPLILNKTITLGYDVPWRKVHEVLISAAQATSHILENPSPFVLQTSLDDFYVSYEINAYTDKPAIMARTFSELFQNLQDKCNEAGIEILSPHYSAARDGNQLAVPEEYFPQGYQVPSFRITSLGNLSQTQVEPPHQADPSSD